MPASARAVLVTVVLALAALVFFPCDGLRVGIFDGGIAEHVRMAAHHLVADRSDDVGEGERALLLRHARMEHHLQQQVAQLVLQVAQVAAVDRIGDLVGLFDRVRRDAGEVLFDIPGATALRIAQARHDGEQAVDRR